MAACKKTIILGSFLVVFSFRFALASNPLHCKQCLELSAADCAQNQVDQTCNSTTIGVTHCASAEGLFVDESQRFRVVRTGFARACINCTDKEQACQDFATFLKKERNFILKECEIKCCTTNNCNSATTPTLPRGPDTCYTCLKSTAAECQRDQITQSCRSDPSSLGITHCGSAAIKFTNSGGVIEKGFVRGCIDCEDTKKACEEVGTFLKEEYDYTLHQCEPECCNTTNCNTATPSLPTGSTVSRHARITEVLVLATVLVGLFPIF